LTQEILANTIYKT